MPKQITNEFNFTEGLEITFIDCREGVEPINITVSEETIGEISKLLGTDNVHMIKEDTQ
jgi:hypothetical protein